MAIEPDRAQLTEIIDRARDEGDGPIVMLNLNRYRDRDAYARYAEVAAVVLAELGGRVLWHAPAEQTVVGGSDERWDEVLAIYYPSRTAFIALASDPRTGEARTDRVAGLEQATLLCVPAGSEDAPFAGVESYTGAS
jgi:uncharacterized protein (DUF1330 family)